MDRQDRISAIIDVFSASRIDALFITSFHTILYLTGFRTLSPHEREAFLLVTREKTYLFTDGRYAESNPRLFGNMELRVLTREKRLMQHVQELTEKHNIGSLGFEREDMKWSEYELFRKYVKGNLVPVALVGVSLRAVKDKKEIASIQKACELGDRCLVSVSKQIHPGMSEKQIAWEMEKWIREKGYEFSFDPIVAVDKNAALPHYNTKTGTGKVNKRSLVLIDMGVKFHDYCSDITRMFSVGEPFPEIRKAYDELLHAQEETLQYLGKIAKLHEADAFCRRQLEGKGYATYPHSTGHGIGLEVHEYPKLSAVSFDTKKPGQVFTVEPGIYEQGKWGMRIEDTVVVEENGTVRPLTKYTKKLRIV